MECKLRIEKNRVKDLPEEGMCEIELTYTEEYIIYCGKQHKYDRANIDDAISNIDDEDFIEIYGIEKSQITEDMKEKMAYRMREYLERYDDDSLEYARGDAIGEIIETATKSDE